MSCAPRTVGRRPRRPGRRVSLGVSRHLRILRDAAWWRCADGQRRLYLRPEPLAEIDDRLAPYRKIRPAKLDALGRHLDERNRDR
jgi:hypothetical protein